jgi:GNAT superfamily N-acetyltransferase
VTEPHGDRSGAIRPATFADIPEIRSILAEHGNDGPHTSVDIVGPYLRHLIAVGRTLVAEEDAHLVGFGATLETGRGLHLADLFVRRNRLGGGIGRQLLDGVYADRWPRTTFASISRGRQRSFQAMIAISRRRARTPAAWPPSSSTGRGSIDPRTTRSGRRKLTATRSSCSTTATSSRPDTGVPDRTARPERSTDYSFGRTTNRSRPPTPR